jgi:hypothetical protein
MKSGKTFARAKAADFCAPPRQRSRSSMHVSGTDLYQWTPNIALNKN